MIRTLAYVYCLVRSARHPSLRGAPPPMPAGGPLRLVDAGDGLRVVISSVAAEEYDEAALARGLQDLDWVGRRAMAHEAVVEHFLSAPAVLPMQMFTLFTSDDRAVQHVAANRQRIDRILSRVERQLEWGLRLTFDEKAARDAVERAHAGSARAVKARAAHSKTGAQTTAREAAARTFTVRETSGASYLARKRDLLDVNRIQLSEARAEADRLYRALAREATEARRRTATEQAAPGSRLLLDAAFLVPARRSASFRASLRRSTRTLGASGLVVSLTGPWPPYNFIDSPKPRKQAVRSSR